MQAVYPHMKAAGWGRIVNFGSSMGRVGGEGFGAYNASKEGIRGLSRTAAREWAADGIIVNVHRARGRPAASRSAASTTRSSCGRARCAATVTRSSTSGRSRCFLCTDACRYVTGHTFMVDGGNFLWS